MAMTNGHITMLQLTLRENLFDGYRPVYSDEQSCSSVQELL